MGGGGVRGVKATLYDPNYTLKAEKKHRTQEQFIGFFIFEQG